MTYADQAGHNPTQFPNVQAWTKRIEALPGYAGPESLLPRESRAV